MRIEVYFQQARETLDACPAVQSSNVAYDKRSTHHGSVLHLREFVDVETTVDRLTYVYQYMDSAQQLAFRYDNTGHHRKLNLSTYPHHKHAGRENNVVASPAPDLGAVLSEIEALVQLP